MKKTIKAFGIFLAFILVFSCFTAVFAANLSTPKLVKVTKVNYKTLRVQWKPVSGASGYEILRKDTKSSYKQVGKVTGKSKSTYLDSTVKTGTRYTYTVRAYTITGSRTVRSSYNSKGLSASATLSAPVFQTLSLNSQGKPKIVWKRTTGANGYEVYRSQTRSGTYSRIKTTSTTLTNITDTSNLLTGKTYYYKIRAYRNVDSKKIYSPYSTVRSVTIKKASLKSISLKPTSLNLTVNQSANVTVKANPANASLTGLKWSSSRPSIASVVNGKVTGKKAGTAVITASVGSKVAKLTVKVIDVQLDSIKMNQTSANLTVGQNLTLTVKPTPSNAALTGLKWSSSTPSVASVNNGKVIAKSAGSTTITARTSSGKTAVCKITVTAALKNPTSIKLSRSSASLDVGESLNLTVIPIPADANVSGITWSSSNTAVASVSSGKVSALAAGNAVITARAKNGKTAACNVTVSQPVSPSSDTLVAYFSATNTTEKIAQTISKLIGADLYEITPEDPYTAADLSYNDNSSRCYKENNDPSARPAISGKVTKMNQYKTVYLGYPIWFGKAPKIINTFLESYDFGGKTIIPFCTFASSGIGSSATDLTSLTPGASWKSGMRFSGNSSESTVKNWLESLSENSSTSQEVSANYDGVFPQHSAYGKGIGVSPGRVVWAYDPDTVDWNGQGYWWELNHFNEERILNSVNSSITSLASSTDAGDGWARLFEANKKSRNLSGGYKSGEKIAIKCNINGSAVMDNDTSGETKMSYTNPVLLKALLTSLVEKAGVRPSDITVYDVSRLFPDYMVQMCSEGELSGIEFVNRDNAQADNNVPIKWSESFSGNTNYLPTCVTQATYLINLANLKGHSYGITLCAKNHFGSFINGNSMRPPEGAGLHQWLTKNQMGIYSPLVDLTAHADLGKKTVLYMLDAIICAPSEGASITGENSKWKQTPFNGDYTSSVFVSQDPVAIDSVGADFLINEPTVTENNGVLRNNITVENYLHEAGLVGNAPSKVRYTDSKGNIISNLGVHEHWNNNTQKQYGRNLGNTEGIELVRIIK